MTFGDWLGPQEWQAVGLSLRVAGVAMLASLPIVVSHCGALPELITHEHTGLVVDPENSAALASAIVRVLTQRTRARLWGQAARQSALVRFSPAQFAHHFAAIYRSVYRG